MQIVFLQTILKLVKKDIVLPEPPDESSRDAHLLDLVRMGKLSVRGGDSNPYSVRTDLDGAGNNNSDEGRPLFPDMPPADITGWLR